MAESEAVGATGDDFSLEKMLALIEEHGVAFAKAVSEKLKAEPMVSRPSWRPRANEVAHHGKSHVSCVPWMQSRLHRRPSGHGWLPGRAARAAASNFGDTARPGGGGVPRACPNSARAGAGFSGKPPFGCPSAP